jgi:hypothetical protein
MFSKDEMIQAKQFRSLSQKGLRHQILTHEKIGVLFNTGLDAVLLSYSRYQALINQIEASENALEDLEIAVTMNPRLNIPTNEWLNHPEGVSTLELYRQRQQDHPHP